MGGTASVLADYLRDKIDCKVRAIEFSLMQRCAAHLASLTDVEEAFLAGQTAVRCAVDGMTDLMVGFQRPAEGPYQCEINLVPLSKVANTEKKVPRDWINDEGNFVNQQFIDYALPLIQGESKIALEDGLPRFANLKKVPVTG
jgi:6-phosphofructokinase